MGIVVCIGMLLGLSVLRPTPWNSAGRAKHAPEFVLFTAAALLSLGVWNVLYAYSHISGFWFWASLVSGSAMVLASFYIFSERGSEPVDRARINSASRKVVVAVLALSFLLYAVTLIQLNLGYAILS